MDENKERYWFPAKKYGWGWGFPTKREGWLVLVAYFALVLVCVFFVIPHNRSIGFLLIALLSLALVAICYKKGEPPSWRWG